MACSGRFRTDANAVWLRLVDGWPVRHVTTACLAWSYQRPAVERKRVPVRLWDHASWPRC